MKTYLPLRMVIVCNRFVVPEGKHCKCLDAHL